MSKKNVSNTVSELLSLTEIGSLFKHFSAVTGLDVALYDRSGDLLLSKRCDHSVCACLLGLDKCREKIVYGGLKSAQLGEPYIYTCGCGLIMCSAPVVTDHVLIASIVCGPVMLWDADDYAKGEFETKLMAMQRKGTDWETLFRSVKTINCEIMTAAAKLLFVAVGSICSNNSIILSERALIGRQQAQISELIAERKEKKVKGATDGTLKEIYSAETERALILAVQSGSTQEAKRILNEILGSIFLFYGGNTSSMRARIFELIAHISRTASDCGAALGEVDSIVGSALGVLSGDTGFEELCHLTTTALERFISIVYVSRPAKRLSVLLASSIAYIEENYRLDVSLTSVAAAVFISPYYLSHLFRMELDTTFSDYLNGLRIDKAKEIAKDQSLRIQDIAERAGFKDANYFTKMFKKLTGLTPKDYRRLYI